MVNSELETEPSKSPGQELREHLENKVHWKSIGLWLLVGLCVLIAVVWFGRHGADQIKAMEAWVVGHGVVGWIVFVGMMIVLMSVFVPDTVLALAAGAMFGLGLGTVLCFIACTLTAAINFLTARWLLRPRIEQMVQGQPKLVAIERAAEREGLRLLLLLRLAPLSAVMVSYSLGTSDVRFRPFLVATVGLIPWLLVEVYFGAMASHMTKVAGNVSDHSALHTVITVVGFVISIVLLIAITRIASKAIADARMEN